MHQARRRTLTALAGVLALACSSAAQGGQDPAPIPGVEVVFLDGSTKLAGTIFRPRTDAACAAVVVLGGAERGPRDAWKERMATAMASLGVAALVYDSPGTGGSTGNALLQTRAARAREAIAAVRFLKAREGILPDRVGTWGTSEGANIALLAAAECQDIAFAMAASGMFCMSPLEIARYRIEAQGADLQLSLVQVQKALLFEEILFAMATGPEIVEWPLLEAKALRWPEEPWTQLVAVVRRCRSEMSRGEKDELVAALGRTIGAWRHAAWFPVAVPQPEKLDRILAADADAVLAYLRANPLAAGDWYASWREYGKLAAIRCPIIAVWGGKDRFVPPRRSAAALRVCLGEAKDRDLTIQIVPGASHVFTAGDAGSAFVGGYPGLLVDWLRQRIPDSGARRR